MKPEKIFEELQILAEQSGLKVRHEKGAFRGGYCILHEQKMVIINKYLPMEGKSTVLARSLVTFPLETQFLKPAIREFLEKERKS